MVVLADTPFHKDSDRGMSLAEWQDWMVDLIIQGHDRDCSDNQLRFTFAAEFNRRFGKQQVKSKGDTTNGNQ